MKKRLLTALLIIGALPAFSTIISKDTHIKTVDDGKPYIVEVYKKNGDKFGDLSKNFKLGVFYLSPNRYQLLIPVYNKNKKDYDLVKSYIASKPGCVVEKEYSIYVVHAMEVKLTKPIEQLMADQQEGFKIYNFSFSIALGQHNTVESTCPCSCSCCCNKGVTTQQYSYAFWCNNKQ